MRELKFLIDRQTRMLEGMERELELMVEELSKMDGHIERLLAQLTDKDEVNAMLARKIDGLIGERERDRGEKEELLNTVKRSPETASGHDQSVGLLTWSPLQVQMISLMTMAIIQILLDKSVVFRQLQNG